LRIKHLKRIGAYGIILFSISLAILLAIGFSELQNESKEPSSFTFWVAVIARISLTICCVFTALTFKKNKRRYSF
jgi:hypothetical protein